jgi:beta/gamma crystallin
MQTVKLARIALTLTIVGVHIPSAAHAGDNCIVYENKNFNGETLALSMNQSVPALADNIDNKISSVRVRPGCILVGFADANFKGASQTWGPGDYPALPRGWDDVISSVQCSCSPE